MNWTMLVLQPLKAKYNGEIRIITETMTLVGLARRKGLNKLGKEPTVIETAKMKHDKISHQTTDFQGNFLQGLKVILPPLPILTPHLVLTCSFHVQG